MYSEFQKLIKNKNFYISFCMLIFIVLASVITGVNNYHQEYSLFVNLFPNNDLSLDFVSPHKEWVGLATSNFFSTLFYFLFPLIISIALVDSIYNEKISGNLNYSLIRMKKNGYYVKKFIFTYCMAFFIFIIPLLIGIGISNILMGHWDYSNYSNVYKNLVDGTINLPDDTFIGDKRELFSILLEKSPYLYILNYYVIGGLFASSYICIGLACSFFIKNKYLVIFIPQTIYTGIWAIFTIIGKPELDAFSLIDPKQPVVGLAYFPLIVLLVVYLLIAITIYVIGVKKNSDVFS